MKTRAWLTAAAAALLTATAVATTAVAVGGTPVRPRTVAARAAAALACDPKASSLAPSSAAPTVTAGSYMARIRARGYLIAGVDQSTYHFGFLNPLDGQIEGFDIDMIRAVAKAIFGNPDKVVSVPYWTDCLVRLQQNDVAGISTDDAILFGLAAQDPWTKVIGPRLTDEPYGLAISQQHPDFVRFVNAVLQQLRTDGQWAASYARWIGAPVPAPPAAQYAP